MMHFRYAALALLIAAPSIAHAQTVPSSIRYIEEGQNLSVFGGNFFTDPGELDLGPQSAPIFGARYTVRLTGPLSGEVTLAGSPSSRTIYRRGPDVDGEMDLIAIGDADQFLLMGDAGLRFNITGSRAWRGLTPFLVGGVGIAANLSGDPEVDDETDEAQVFEFGPAFAVVVGAGTDWFLTERLAIRVDIRDRLWRLNIPAGFTAAGREDTEWTHNIGLAIGAALYF